MSPELDWMDVHLFTRMEGLVGGVLISPTKSKVIHEPNSLVEAREALSQYEGCILLTCGTLLVTHETQNDNWRLEKRDFIFMTPSLKA